MHGQSGAKNGEWRAYGGDTGHTRYSPLTQIDATNFSTLTRSRTLPAPTDVAADVYEVAAGKELELGPGAVFEVG